MHKSATLKDVLYGLEYLGQHLCRAPSGAWSVAWSLEPGGVRVPPSVADKALASGFVGQAPPTKFGESRYQWQAHAA